MPAVLLEPQLKSRPVSGIECLLQEILELITKAVREFHSNVEYAESLATVFRVKLPLKCLHGKNPFQTPTGVSWLSLQ